LGPDAAVGPASGNIDELRDGGVGRFERPQPFAGFANASREISRLSRDFRQATIWWIDEVGAGRSPPGFAYLIRSPSMDRTLPIA